MKKYIFSAVLCICIAAVLSTCVYADDFSAADSQPIDYNVNYIIERMYGKSKIECKPLDISGQANMGFADEVAGDGKGGWTDQGPENDMSSFNLFGNQTFFNIPFNIINPAQNNGKSCIILRGQNNEAFPVSVDIPVNETAYGIYVLHSTAWSANEAAGRYYFVYDDGSSSYFEIVGGQHIRNFWGTTNNNYTRTVWTGTNPLALKSNQVISLNIFALNNPHPEKTIKYIRLESYGAVQFINIVGVTLAKEMPIFPMMEGSASSDMGIVKYGVDAWQRYEDPDERDAAGSVLDMSAYLDAPAGKHGILKASGEDLVFEDGTKAKLWGTNIVGEACFPNKSDAEEAASRIARSGYSLVRFVNFDEQELTDERLDRLSYFMSLLKEKGIYLYFSLLGNEKGIDGDICDGWKIDGIFRDDLINKKVVFTEKLLNYKNKYTGITIGEDPALVMIDMADQNTMYDYEPGVSCLNVSSEESKTELKAKFNKFLKNKYSSTAKLKKAWGDVLPSESIEKGTVNINGNWKYGIFDDGRKKDVIDFFAKLQTDYINIIGTVARNAGYRGLISGFTNTWNNLSPLNSTVNAKTDFIPVNMMFSMCLDRTESWPYAVKLKDGLIYTDTDSTVTSDGHDGKALINLVKNRISGVPFVVSEWGAANVSKMYIENSFVMAAVAAQQGWTPIQYCFLYNEINKDKITDLYSAYSNPVTLGMSYAAAALYYTTDALGSSKTVYQDKNALYSNKTNNLTLSEYLNSRTSTVISAGKSSGKTASNDEFVIDNSGIYWDMLDGVFFANTDEVIAFSGKTPGKESVRCLEFEIYDSEAAVSLVSLDGRKIEQSGHMLLSVANDAANKGTEYKTKYLFGKIGDGGIVYKSLSGRFVIKNGCDYDIYAVLPDGSRGNPVEKEITPEGFTAFYTGIEKTINYEIVRREAQ